MNQLQVPVQVLGPKRKVAIYCRVSTTDQKGGMESQIRCLREFCEKNNITNFEFFCDEGISGAKADRPALNRMMAAIRAKEM